MARTGIQGGGAGAVTLTGQAVGGDLSGNWPNLQIGAGAVGASEVGTGLPRTALSAVEGRHVLGAAGEPTLASGWSQFEPVSYWLDTATETVGMQGILLRTGAYTSGTTIFTLPTGYRPTGTKNRDLFIGKYVSSVGVTLLQVGPSGIVFIGENLVDQTYVYVDAVRFRL